MTDNVENLPLYRFLKRMTEQKNRIQQLGLDIRKANDRISEIRDEATKNLENQKLINAQLEREIAAYKERHLKKDAEELNKKKERHLHIVK